MEHAFTATIIKILEESFPGRSQEILDASLILQYLNIKTKSASRGSKARSSFGNIYAIYVLVEDYIAQGFHEKSGYNNYEGAKFSDIFRRQRELPFGSKLQNHALNHRMNQEFKKYFPSCEFIPILRDASTSRYWINENLLLLGGTSDANIAQSIIRIIDAYIEAKKDAFEKFISTCVDLQNLGQNRVKEIEQFVFSLLEPNIDARIFEIVSYAILKGYYADQSIFWGWSMDDIREECLILYKTGRTNANDGGIDFVMKPLGRFFQVTETTDVRKYFLDIDKVQRYPISFVIKSDRTPKDLLSEIEKQARRVFSVDKIVKRYVECVEEIVNIPELESRFRTAIQNGRLKEERTT